MFYIFSYKNDKTVRSKTNSKSLINRNVNQDMCQNSLNPSIVEFRNPLKQWLLPKAV